jgi:hypothetical protein
MDPVVTDDPVTSALRESVGERVRRIDGEATMHDFRLVPGPTHVNMIMDVVLPLESAVTESELRSGIESFCEEISRGAEVVYFAVVNVDRPYATPKR